MKILSDKFLVVILVFLIAHNLYSQVFINEISNKNYTQVYDDYGKNDSWIELYNAGKDTLNLSGWFLSDDKSLPDKWMFPGSIINPGSFKIVYASDNSRKSKVDHWEFAVIPSDSFDYIEPTASTPSNWYTLEFKPQAWKRGKAPIGFGYDNILSTTSTTTTSIYVRRNFIIPDTSVLADVAAFIDYDDAFVAYFNGIEICRNHIYGTPGWRTNVWEPNRALMVSGGMPERYSVDMDIIKHEWRQGVNVLAVQVFNQRRSATMAIVPHLAFAINKPGLFFNNPPQWFFDGYTAGFHINFKIARNGETIYLSNKDRQIVDSLTIEELPLNYSTGRIKDGSQEIGVFVNATPAKSNNNSIANSTGFEPTPDFSIKSGFYNGVIELIMTNSSPGSIIRYTTDGSDPVETSFLYNGKSVQLGTTKVIKARTFSVVGKLPGKIKTATYFIDVKYSIPVFSITTNPDNLTGETGIFNNWQEDWKKPCYIEFYDKNQNKEFDQSAGILIDGGAGGSRSQPQHSFRIEADNDPFGEGDFNYKFFPDRPNRTNYSSLYFRNGSNQYMILPYKDAAEVKSISKGTNNYYSAYTPVVAFINGEYWGVYELREKVNADYFKYNYGADKSTLDLLTLSYWNYLQFRALEGSTVHFWDDYNRFINLDPKDQNYLIQADQLFELKYYTDYIIAQSWINNTDWPGNNIKVFRSDITNYKWRFVVLDVEWALDPNSWSKFSDDHIAFMLGQSRDIPFVRIWQDLIKNQNYKVDFINRFCDVMNTNYLYSNMEAIEQAMFTEVYPEMGGEFKKWGGSNISTQLSRYVKYHLTLLNSFKNRTEYVRKHLLNNFGLKKQVELTLDVKPAGSGKIKISTITPDAYPWTGVYFDGNPVTITAIPNTGYVFSDWDKNSMISDLNNPVISKNLNVSPLTLTAHFKSDTIKFSAITISEIYYNDVKSINSSDWIELYNFGNIAANLNGWYFTDEDSTHRYDFLYPTIIPANGRLVVVSDVNKFTAAHPSVKNYIGPFPFGLGSPSDHIKIFNEKDSLVAEVNYEASYPWPAGAAGEGKSLELLNPGRNLNDPSSWIEGCIGGSPGEVYIPCIEPLKISEINYNSSPDFDSDDWIELWNTSETDIDIGSWTFKNKFDSCIFKMPSALKILANSRWILVRDKAKFLSVHPGIENVTGNFLFDLSSVEDKIRLYDKEGHLKLSIQYSDHWPWPFYPGTEYFTLELNDPQADITNGNNWFKGCPEGSPGKPYGECMVVSVDKLLSLKPFELKVYPVPAKDFVDIEFNLDKPVKFCHLKLYNILGEEIRTVKLNALNSGIYKKRLSLKTLNNNVLILKVLTDSSEKTMKIVR